MATWEGDLDSRLGQFAGVVVFDFLNHLFFILVLSPDGNFALHMSDLGLIFGEQFESFSPVGLIDHGDEEQEDEGHQQFYRSDILRHCVLEVE